MVFEPGTRSQYNQTNYLLLKRVIETVTGSPFLDVVTDRMIGPAGLKSAAYGGEYAIIPGRATTYFAGVNGLRINGPIDQPDYMFASSGLNISALDLATWFAALLDGDFLSPATLDRLWSPQLLADGTPSGFAHGWEFYTSGDMRAVGHGGGNRVDLRHFTFTDGTPAITVIYFTNGAQIDFWPGMVAYELAAQMRKILRKGLGKN